jgi:hypothetical protein
LYNIENIIEVVLKNVQVTHDAIMTDALAILYLHNKQYEQTLAIYLQRKSAEAFGLIEKYDLYDSVQNRVCSSVVATISMHYSRYRC